MNRNNNSGRNRDFEEEEILIIDEQNDDEYYDEDQDEFDEDYEEEGDFEESDMLSLIDTAAMNASDLAKLVIENNYRNGERLETEDIYRIYSDSFSNILSITIAHKI